MLIFIILALQFVRLAFGGYSQNDSLASQQELVIAGQAIQILFQNDITQTFNSLVTFDNHTFGLAYFRDQYPYASFIKNGQDLYGEVQIASNLTQQHGIQSCKVNQHDMLVIYSGDNQISFAQMVTKEGNNILLKGNQIQILTEKVINARCIQLSQDVVGIAYMAKDENLNTSNNWGVFFNTYQVQSQTLGTAFRVNDLNSDYQGSIKLDKTTSGKLILVFQTNYLIGASEQRVKAQGQSNIKVSSQQKLEFPSLFCDENGNTYIAWRYYSQQYNIIVKKFDSNMNEQCSFEKQNASTPTMVVYDNIIYLRYFFPDAFVMEVYANNCTLKTQPRFESINYNSYQQDMAVFIEPTGGIFAQLTSDFMTQKLVYTEYLLFGPKPCDNPVCAGCYGTNTQKCRYCKQTTPDQQALRKNITGGGCSCIDQYFSDDSDNLCKQCHVNCATCSNSSSCNSCLFTDRNLTNMCNCQDGTYDDAFVCFPCNYKCKTCQSSNSCDLCAPNRYKDQHGDCKCNERFYDDPGAETCSPCAFNCLQCTSINQCQLCEDGYYAEQQGQSAICKQCSYRCATCNNTATNCTLSCPPLCSQCDTTGKCIGCQIDSYLDANNNCINCHPKCYSCQQQYDTCKQCSNGQFRLDISQNCVCQEGYYETGEKNCKQCLLSNCKICDQNGDCLECKNTILDTKDCQSVKISSFQASFTLQLDEKQMFDLGICSLKCLNCEAKTGKCLKCNLAKNRDTQLPCNCLQGYHDQRGKKQDCEECQNTCLDCISFYECTKCDESKNRVLDKFQQSCVCKEGFKENKMDNSCQQCFEYNGKCLQDCPPHTIKDPIYYICKEVQFSQKSLKYIFGVCGIVLCSIGVMLFLLIKLMSQNMQHNNKGKLIKFRKVLQNQDTNSI